MSLSICDKRNLSAGKYMTFRVDESDMCDSQELSRISDLSVISDFYVSFATCINHTILVQQGWNIYLKT